MSMKIDAYSAPLMVSWQLTKDCNLACLHCCTESAPGRALPGELSHGEAMSLADQIIAAQVPYVMLCGGEPTIVPFFYDLAKRLGEAGVFLKIETNGQNVLDVDLLKTLPIRSIQVSIDGAIQETYGKMRPGGSLEKALAACRQVRQAGLPLEITFAPTRLNLHEAEAVISLAVQLGAFRFNTGRLMRLGTAAKLWDRLESSSQDYDKYLKLLESKEAELAGRMELCFRPFDVAEELSARSAEPPGTLLVLPDGKVRLSGALPAVCADLKQASLSEAWNAYRDAWKDARHDMPALLV